MTTLTPLGHRPETDPALLAFIKCHIRSVATWDALCVLSRDIGRWSTQDQLVRELKMPPARIAEALASLAADGVIECQSDNLGAVYRIPANEPTTVVVERLFSAARVDQNLRRIVVAHMLHGAVGAAELHPAPPARPGSTPARARR